MTFKMIDEEPYFLKTKQASQLSEWLYPTNLDDMSFMIQHPTNKDFEEIKLEPLEDFLVTNTNQINDQYSNSNMRDEELLNQEVSISQLHNSLDCYFPSMESLDFNGNQLQKPLQQNLKSQIQDSNLLFNPPQLSQKKQTSNPFNINLQKRQAPVKKVLTKNYEKNCCRYITRTVIRAFQSAEYEDKVLSFCPDASEDIYLDAIDYFSKKLEYINGFRALKQYLKINQDDEPKMQQIKKVFINFFEWFLKNRYVRYLMKEGRMKDKQQYLKYKNEVMLKFLSKPDQWNSNKANDVKKN